MRVIVFSGPPQAPENLKINSLEERLQAKFAKDVVDYAWRHSVKARRIIKTRWGTLIFVRARK